MKHTGFTLFELLVTLSIAGILSLLAWPAMTHFIAEYQLMVKSNQILGAVQFARNQAVTYQAVVTTCPSAGYTCSKEWNQGLLSFIDSNKDGRRQDSERLINYLSLTELEANLVLKKFGRERYLQFLPNGRTRQVKQAGAFWICPFNNAFPVRAIKFNRQGRIWSGADRDHNGRLDNHSRAETRCEN